MAKSLSASLDSLSPRPEPRLVITDHVFRCGYGPRSIGLSCDHDRLFVGCKDGSVTAIDLNALPSAQTGYQLCGAGATPGVRSLCDLGNGWLLLGQDGSGGLSTVRCGGGLQQPFPLPLPDLTQGGAVGYIGPWDDRLDDRPDDSRDGCLFVVSSRLAEAVCVRVTDRVRPNPGEPPFTLEVAHRLPGVVALGGMARVGPDERWLVCKTGALWQVAGGEPIDRTTFWGHHERPGFVFDVAVVRREEPAGYDLGLYLSTDLGVFLLRRPRDTEDHRCFRLDAAYLAGLSGMCLAVTHAVFGDRCFLWVSDAGSSVHLYWSESSRLTRRPVWCGSGLRQRDFPVMRAVSRWRPERPQQVLIGQACRDDRVVVTTFDTKPDDGLPDPQGNPLLADEVLSWATADWLREHLPEGSERWRKDRSTWTIESLVADQIEEVGANRETLRRFLRNPGIRLACSTLEEIFAAPNGTTRAEHALVLWTQTLVGTVHRSLGEPTTEDHLGVVRWLRRLGDQCRAVDVLRAPLASCIQFARKWGVFGSTYATRARSFAALRPLAAQNAEERRFDRLVYESLFFVRRRDLEEELLAPSRRELTPWDLGYLGPDPRPPAGAHRSRREFLVAAWLRSGLIFERPVGGEWCSRPLPPGFSRLGRRIHLGFTPRTRRPYLLAAPVSSPVSSTDSEKPRLELFFLADEGTPRAGSLEVASLVPEEDAAAANGSAKKSADEMVYSLLDLGAGRIAVGLRGVAGESRFGIVLVDDGGQLRALQPTAPCTLRPAYPELKHSERNEISALACAGAGGGPQSLFLGCADGQVWKVDLRFLADHHYEPQAPVLVGRLHAPVRALACSVHHAEESDSQDDPEQPKNAMQRRVFAGGSDGTLIAFQELYPGSWATLWTLDELGGAIARVFTVDLSLAPAEAEGDVSAADADDAAEETEAVVLAVTQQGLAVLISNRATCEKRRPGDERQLRRVRVPGERLGRFSLESSALAATLMPLPAAHTAEARRGWNGVARLAVVTNTGDIRLLRLHYPKFTALRKRKFQELCNEWMHHLRDPQTQEITGHLLRRPETTLGAGLDLPAFMVRWILPYNVAAASWAERSRQAGFADEATTASQWLPRHLRPLLDLEAAWSDRGTEIAGKLEAALTAARRVEDRRLFKEIVEAVLTRANHHLFAEALRAQNGSDIPFAANFQFLMQDLEAVMGAWVGAPGGLDVRMRITIAKNLLDGDTLWSLARARQRGTPAGQDDRAKEAMDGRIRLVRDCLAHGNRLLAEETLRAANLALTRLCRRLVRGGAVEDLDWRDEAGAHQLPWESLPGFFEAVGDFAARSTHPRGSLGEVATHEICRAYALGMLICPAGVVRLASWLAETDPPSDMGKRVLEQLDVLSQLLGMRLPGLQVKLLHTALGVRAGTGRADEALFNEWTDEVLTGPAIGTENRQVVLDRRPFDRIVQWLHNLARQLLDEAGDVELHRVGKLLADIDGTAPQARHSQRFWREALVALAGLIQSDRDLKIPAAVSPLPPAPTMPSAAASPRVNPVRPALVLFVRDLRQWCREQRDRIRDLRKDYELFDPLAGLYDEALSLVERASGRFPYGAAVQKNLVLGVLGHGLMEMLDEHLLEVWEVAQALDPLRTWKQDGPSPLLETASTAGRFADYLLRRAVQAEAIPKNLRSLQGLLSHSINTHADAFASLGMRPLQQLLQEFVEREQWQLEIPPDLGGIQLNPRRYHLLRLTLDELAQNDRVHGLRSVPGHQEDDDALPRVYAGDHRGPRIQFKYPRDDHQRVCFAIETSGHFQAMVKPRPEPQRPSHGSGLYLANLAAASAGWKLDVVAYDQPGILIYQLKRMVEDDIDDLRRDRR